MMMILRLMAILRLPPWFLPHAPQMARALAFLLLCFVIALPFGRLAENAFGWGRFGALLFALVASLAILAGVSAAVAAFRRNDHP